MPECSLVQNLTPCFLTFCSTIEFNPYLPFEFLSFYVICFLYMLHIHNNLSAGAQNVTKCYRRLSNNYACLQALVNNALTWQGSCVIANKRLFVQGYNLKVHDVIKDMRKHRATCKPSFCVM